MDALLLLGPTGVGKTPLGEELARSGLGARRCLHFDFGAVLRRTAEGTAGRSLDGRAQAVVRRVLEEGALLEDDDFPIATALLGEFLGRLGPQAGDLLVLNGLPRHRGQALGLERLLRVRLLVHLQAQAGVIRERIRLDSAGDRAGRRDDDEARVAARLARDALRCAPLLAHYSARGVPCLDLGVDVDTTARQIRARLASWWERCPREG